MLVMILGLMLATEAAAQPCPVQPVLPRGFAGWTVPGNRPGIGRRFDVTGARAVAGETAQERARGGKALVVEITVPRAGSYAVALSDAAWIDLVRNGKTQAATGHQHGDTCSGIRKIVRFDLLPGQYQLRLSGIKADRIGIMIADQ